MTTDVKLGKSLDDIIKENSQRKPKPKSGSGPIKASKGMRIDGARGKLRAGSSKGPRGKDSRRAPIERSAPRGGSGASSGLGVRSAGIKKRGSGRQRPAYDDDDDDMLDYGMEAPRQRRPQGGRGGGRRGGVPRGNPDDKWTHDLYDDTQGPAKRSRLAGRLGNPNSAELRVSNLGHTVTKQDIEELFGTCGKVLTAEILYDHTARSSGEAKVVYEKRSEAEAAIKEYDGVKLDGQELRIIFAPEADTTVLRLSSGKNIERPSDVGRRQPSARGGGGMGFRRAMNDALPSRSGGGGGGRGRLRSGVVVRHNKDDLDADMDNYMQE